MSHSNTLQNTIPIDDISYLKARDTAWYAASRSLVAGSASCHYEMTLESPHEALSSSEVIITIHEEDGEHGNSKGPCIFGMWRSIGGSSNNKRKEYIILTRSMENGILRMESI